MAIYRYDGTPITAEAKALSNMFEFWDAPTTYTGMNGSQNADQLIENLFDPFVDNSYVTKETIGKDASNTYNMYAYFFTPAAYTQTIWIQSGVHSREKAAVFGLYHFLDEVVNNWQSHNGLNFIRNNVRMIVVPCVNPWGLSQANPGNDGNSNGINLNRDGIKQTQTETQNVIAVFDTYKDDISFAMDCHTTVNSSYGDYAYKYPTISAMKNLDVLKRTLAYLCEKNIKDREPDLSYFSPENTDWFIKYYAQVMPEEGVVCLSEHADFVWDSHSKYSAICIQRSAELVVNTIIQHVGEHYYDRPLKSKYFPDNSN